MEASSQRREAVDKARQSWIKRLIDLSRRNNLLFYRTLKHGTLNLSLGAVDRWAALLRGDTVSLKSLVSGLPDDDLPSKVLSILRRAQANQEEKGLATMFIALGMASWTVGDGGRDSDAPVLLLPVELEMKGHAGTSVSIRRSGAVQVNLVLLHMLSSEFGVSISSDDVLAKLQGNEEGELFDPVPVHELFTRACSSIPEFRIRDVAVLGNFAFQKMAMVRDLQDNLEDLVSSDLIAALAGDTAAKQSIGSKSQNPDPREFDTIPPQSEFLILDADSSQQSAIYAVLAGQSAVIHGPPGTGKSQTIANLVASLAAAGKRVLFVAEKRAALQVVLKRLQQVGLDKIAIDLHGADVSPRRVMEQVGAALNSVRQAVPVDCDQTHERYVIRRNRLNHHVECLHKKRKPSGMSVYELQGALLRLGIEADSAARWRGQELTKIEKSDPSRVRDLLKIAKGFASLFLGSDPSPWNGVKLADGASAQDALDLVARFSSQTCPDFTSSLTELIKTANLRAPRSTKAAVQLYSLVASVGQTLDLYSAEIYSQDIQAMVRSLAPGKSGGLRAIWTWCANRDYRRARHQALGLRTAGKAPTPQIFAELAAAEDQRLNWADWSGRSSLPQRVASYDDSRRKLDKLVSDITKLSSLLLKKQLDSLPLDELGTYIAALAADRLTPMKLPTLWAIEQELEQSGVSKLTAEIRKRKVPPEKWVQAFDHAWYASCLEAAQIEDPEIGGFNGRTHDDFVREFKALDKERVRIAAARVRRAYGERAIGAMNEYKNEEYVIRSEVEKKRRHRPLRALFADARHVLTAVCPCWMVSPLSVSQLLDATRCFDFVIFDEASQVLPEDAIPAVMRASHLVVAGDRWQLPPTTFFAAADDDELLEDEAAVTDGYESLLDTTNAFMPSWYLDWHYRSRDEALISFSNHHIYKDRMVTFPGPGGPPAIQHFLVHQPPDTDGQEESSAVEVNKVVELIVEHAENRPEESLGVIAMGIRHADRVQRALDQAILSRPDLAQFFDASADERFFIKNLERVQGDERDAIILTVGYGKDRGGNLPFRFGPLLSVGGQRRLNVAITRARQHMTLVSSFSHMDMDLAKVKPGTGVELLRYYLEYASSGGKRLGDLVSTDFPMNSFEAEVFDVLASKGIPLVPQVGASSYRIDLVAQHPEQLGRFVLAIECDGASYHSSPTARDRDRLRQQQLENLGWKFHRIWSTDWFMRKDEEVNRAVAVYENAVASADRSTQGSAGSPESPQTKSAPIPIKPRGRSPRPQFVQRDSILEYTESEIDALIDWMESDGRLRTNEEIIDELLPELGFHRRGARIEGALKSILEKRKV